MPGIGEVRKAYNISVSKPEQKMSVFGSLGTDERATLKETVHNDIEFVHLSQDRDW
jgi:hypothetical protein